MLKMLKSQNPDKEYPSNTGQKWTDEEEILLLEELNKNIDIDIIAKTHNRTTGGINSRRKEIAYKMYNNNINMEEIIMKTKLEENIILDTITKKKNNPKICKSIKENKKIFSLEAEIDEMKNDIKDLKNIVKELAEMMKAVYDFEES